MRIILTILLSTSISFAQMQWEFNMGYGSYKMKSLKSFQEKLSQRYPVNAQITSSFPSFWYYELAAKWEQNKTTFFGASLSFGSTGGRIYYSDYSGSIGSDQLVSFVSYGGTVGRSKGFFNDKLNLELELKYLLMIGTLKISEYNSFSGSITNDQFYNSTNLAIQPNFNLKYRVRLIGFNSSIGYNLNLIKGELKDIDRNYFINESNPTYLDWSGIRASVGISFYIKNPSEDDLEAERLSIGLGAGLEYGGLGINALVYPQKNLGFFFGAGYALAGFGYNGGIKLRKNPVHKTTPYLIAMYGYNAAIRVGNAPDYNRLFFGPSVGFGLDFKRSSEGSGYWTTGILIPIRNSSVDQYIDNLERSGVEFKNTLLPITFSVGYRITQK
jgi:hypothetical protein